MTPAAAVGPRVRLPVPRWVTGTAIVVVLLEVAGWVTRVSDVRPSLAVPLSMDAPYSLPRLVVAGVFLAAGLAAAAGAQRLTGRRTWWTAIAVTAVGVALVKAGSTLHARAVQAVGGYEHPVRSLVVFGGAAVVVIAWLYWLSRSERRDRRRVLMWLGLYACAAVGLSTLSAMAQAALGYANLVTASTVLVEEAGEALAAVGLLFAVLVGVAPRLVLPSDWAFNRPTDDGSPTGVHRAPARRARGGSVGA